MSFLTRSFDIKPGEGRTASLMLAHSFCMGLATVFFETAASALFLARFDKDALPYVYVVAAVLNIGLGAVYSTLQSRTRFSRLMAGTVGGLLFGVILLRIGLTVVRGDTAASAGLIFVLLVYYRALSILTDLEYWAVAARLYDVRQAKRLFGVIGSGEVVARIAGSFAVPVLLQFVWVNELLTFSAIALLACLALVQMVLSANVDGAPAPAKSGKPKKDAEQKKEGRSFIPKDPYLRLIIGLAICGVLAKYFVDFAFLGAMKERYGSAKGLASFFAVFSGVSQVLSLLTRVFISGKLLNKYGVRVTLLVLPAVHVACTVAVVVGGFLHWQDAVFWLVIANQGIYKTLKHPIDNPSFKVLYQPLKKEDRLGTQVAVETLITPVTIGLAGLVMIVFTKAIRYDPVTFSWAMLVSFVAWMVLARKAGRAYSGALLAALKGPLWDEDAAIMALTDEESRGVLRQKLKSQDPAEVLSAMEILEHHEPDRLKTELMGLLAHPSAAVRVAVLERIERFRPPGAEAAVSKRVQGDHAVAVRSAAVRCLCVLQGRENAKYVTTFLEHRNREIQKGAMVGLLHAGWDEADAFLTTRSTSKDAADRLWVAQVCAEASFPRVNARLLPLLADPDVAVRRAALTAAARVKDASLVPALVENLYDREYHFGAAAALAATGEACLPELKKVFVGRTRARVVRSGAWVAGRIKGPLAIGLLRKRLGEPDQRVRADVLDALRACGWRAEGADEDKLHDLIRSEAGEATWALATARDLAEDVRLAPLARALEAEVPRHRDRMLQALALVADAKAVVRARASLSHPSREKRAYAMEMIDVTAPAGLRSVLLALCEDLAPEARLEKLADLAPAETAGDLSGRLADILARPPSAVGMWTRACALRTAGELRVRAVAEAVEALTRDGHPALVTSTARWASTRLAPKRGRAGQAEPEPEDEQMLLIEKVIRLKSVPMFASTPEDVLAEVAGILEEIEVEPGEVIVKKGDPGDSMYVIVKGKVRVVDEERTLTTLGENDIFGELALLDPEPRVASVVASEGATLFRLDRDAFGELMTVNIEIVRGVLHVLCERLRRMSRQASPYKDPPAGQAS